MVAVGHYATGRKLNQEHQQRNSTRGGAREQTGLLLWSTVSSSKGAEELLCRTQANRTEISRCREGEEEGERRRSWEEEKADVLEPEKCPLPREVGPFFPLLTGGENIYKTNRVMISGERGHAAHS